MSDTTQSGKDVIDKFFDEILNIDGIDEKIVNKLIFLHTERKLTDTNIQNALEELLQEEIDEMGENDGNN